MFESNGAVVKRLKTAKEVKEELEYLQIEKGILEHSLAHWEEKEKDAPDNVAMLRRDLMSVEALIYEMEERLTALAEG